MSVAKKSGAEINKVAIAGPSKVREKVRACPRTTSRSVNVVDKSNSSAPLSRSRAITSPESPQVRTRSPKYKIITAGIPKPQNGGPPIRFILNHSQIPTQPSKTAITNNQEFMGADFSRELSQCTALIRSNRSRELPRTSGEP